MAEQFEEFIFVGEEVGIAHVIGHVLAFLEYFIIYFRWLVRPSEPSLVSQSHTLLNLFQAALPQKLGDQSMVITLSQCVP